MSKYITNAIQIFETNENNAIAIVAAISLPILLAGVAIGIYPIRRRIKRIIGYFRRDERGVVAVLFALLAFLLLATIGVGIDMSSVYNKKTMAQMVADEAALYAINKYKSYTEQRISKVKALRLANADAEEYIKERGALLDGKVLKTSANLYFADSDKRTIKADVSISGQHESLMTQALALGDSKAIDYKVESTAQVSFAVGKFEFIFLVDVSPSMGIGASDADRKLMLNTPGFHWVGGRPVGCQFACHEPWVSTLRLANEIGAKLRINVVRRAITSLVSQIEKKIDDIEIKTALYTFSNHLHTKTGLLNGIDKFKTHANSIRIHKERYRGGGTNFHGVFAEFSRVLETLEPKDDVKQHVIILSDAVSHHNLKSGSMNHIWNRTPNYRYYKASFNPRWCDSFKNVPNRTVYGFWVDPEYRGSQYERAMKECATSPAEFYRANSEAEINKAFQDLFNSILQSVYLSN